jgi:2-methylisocitrate lyase-like PEP mutase family enzyme
MRPTTKLRQLLRRKNKVLAVLGAPNAFHAKIMEANGVEACFVGTSITGGNYTGLPDLGILSMTECVEIAKWIARSVKIFWPGLVIRGRRDHGGAAIGPRVHRCGTCRVRLDDQPLEQKRRTMSTGISIVSRGEAVARYHAAVDAKMKLILTS